MYCLYCGKEISDDEKFCPFCGNKVKVPKSKKEVEVIEEEPQEAKSKLPIIIIAAVVAAALIACALFFILGKDDSESVPEPAQTTEPTGEVTQSDVVSPEAEEFNGHYYEVINEGMYWTDAREVCEEKGGHLVTITSQEEEDFIEGLIEDNGSSDIYHYWLGATDEDEEGVWRWVDGEVFWEGGPASKGGHPVGGMYENWLSSQPNNSVKENPEGHDYLEIQVTQGNEVMAEYMTWTDLPNDGVAFGYQGAPDYNDTQYCGCICEWDED